MAFHNEGNSQVSSSGAKLSKNPLRNLVGKLVFLDINSSAKLLGRVRECLSLIEVVSDLLCYYDWEFRFFKDFVSYKIEIRRLLKQRCRLRDYKQREGAQSEALFHAQFEQSRMRNCKWAICQPKVLFLFIFEKDKFFVVYFFRWLFITKETHKFPRLAPNCRKIRLEIL